MSGVARRAELVESLATVAISALSGQIGPGGVAAAKELVKTYKSAWTSSSPERRLSDSVKASIEAWARGELVASDAVDRGLGWAIEYVQAGGSPHDVLAETDFDPVQASARVLREIKKHDRYWGTDLEYAVAGRAVEVTYVALCAQVKTEGGVLLAAIQATRREVVARIAELRTELVGFTTRDDLIRYLTGRIDRWDYSPWTRDKHPSLLERRLRFNTNERVPKQLPAAEALDGTDLLVVLGGPGAGKTWLAQRYAREAAQSALKRLRDPLVDLAAVEIPVLTTWAAWASQLDAGLDGLAAAALPGSADESVRRAVLRRGARVLAVVDSLDEVGKDVNAARRRLRSLPGPPGWRVVVMSRPEAWHTAAPALKDREEVRTGTLVELGYPDDAQAFIRQWFVDAPGSAERLIAQLERRPELRATAAVPLLLTFYCMLTEQTPNQELPWRRRELYREIVDILLQSPWRSRESPDVDLEACHAVLRRWAWSVAESVTPAGLGAWSDVITTEKAPANLEEALDNVVPRQQHPTSSMYDHKRVDRRFLHRTLLEYFVAEHIATMPAKHAASVLLPHVWFDSDWEVALPMAIAAHPKRDKVLAQLWAWHSPKPAHAQAVLNDRLEVLLLEVAALTFPSDWNPTHRSLIDGLRAGTAVREPDLVSQSSHWIASNQHALQAVIDALDDPKSVFWVIGLVRSLPTLAAADADRVAARRSIIGVLRAAPPKQALDLVVHGLLKLKPGGADLQAAREAILDAIPTSDIWTRPDLVRALSAVQPAEADRVSARRSVMDLLTYEYHEQLVDLVDALRTMEPTEADRSTAIWYLLMALRCSDGPGDQVVEAMLALAVAEPHRGSVWNAILAELPSFPFGVGLLVEAVDSLVLTDAELDPARGSILEHIATADGEDLPNLVAVLESLRPTDADQAAARKAVVKAVAHALEESLIDLGRALQALGPTDLDLCAARRSILEAFRITPPEDLPELVWMIQELDATEADRASARLVVLRALRAVHPWHLPRLATALQDLHPTEADLTAARQAILESHPCEPEDWNLVVESLQSLKATPENVTVARERMLACLPPPNAWNTPALVGTLLGVLEPTADDRAAARKAILEGIRDHDYIHSIRDYEALVDALKMLEPTSDEIGSARQLVIGALREADPFDVADLVPILLGLEPTDDDRSSATKVVLSSLSVVESDAVPGLSRALRTLKPARNDCVMARRAILRTMRTTAPRGFPALIRVLQTLEPSCADWGTARDALIRCLADNSTWTARSTAQSLRSLTPIDQWLWLLGVESSGL